MIALARAGFVALALLAFLALTAPSSRSLADALADANAHPARRRELARKPKKPTRRPTPRRPPTSYSLACNSTVILVETKGRFNVRELSFSATWTLNPASNTYDLSAAAGATIYQAGQPWTAAFKSGPTFYSHLHHSTCGNTAPLWQSNVRSTAPALDAPQELWLQYQASNYGTNLNQGKYVARVYDVYGQPSDTLQGVQLYYNIHLVNVNATTGKFIPIVPGPVLACCPVTLTVSP